MRERETFHHTLMDDDDPSVCLVYPWAIEKKDNLLSLRQEKKSLPVSGQTPFVLSGERTNEVGTHPEIVILSSCFPPSNRISSLETFQQKTKKILSRRPLHFHGEKK